MVVMGIAWKIVVGLVLILPMTAYVSWSLVMASADEPREHAPIIIEEPSKAPDEAKQSPSAKPTEKPSGHKTDRGDDHGGANPSDDNTPEIITPSPDDLFDDHGGNDNSGKGSGGGDDSSGKGSGDG